MTCRARFAEVDDLHLLGDLADAQTEAAHGVRQLRGVCSRPTWRRRRARRSASDATSSSRSCGSRKASASPSIACSRSPTRELRPTQEAFRSLAGETERRRSRWRRGRKPRRSIPRRASSFASARQQLDELQTFLERQKLHHAAGQASRSPSRPRPISIRWSFASMWTPGPFESKPTPRLLLPHRRRSVVAARAAGRAPARLQFRRRCGRSRFTRCTRGTSCTTSTCARSSRRRASRSCSRRRRFVEGWAHYCEQMMIEAGFGRQDPTRASSASSPEALDPPRALHRLHQAARRGHVGRAGRADVPREAFMEEASARREAERGTFDPTYLVYTRRQADAAEAAAGLRSSSRARHSRCATFHDTLLGQGTAPFWLHRQLMLGDDGDCWSDGRSTRPMPLYEYRVRAVRPPLRGDPEVLRSAGRDVCPKCGGPVHKLLSSPAIQFKGSGWYITDYAEKDSGRRPRRRLGQDGVDCQELGLERRPTRASSSRHERLEAEQEPTTARRTRSTPKPATTTDYETADYRPCVQESRVRSLKSAMSCTVDCAAQVERRQVGRELAPPGPAAAARSRPPPSGTRACCPCRGGRP